MKRKDPLLREKIGAIATFCKKAWFYGVRTEAPETLLMVKEGKMTFPGQITPVMENGRYRNYPGEDLWKQFWETQYLLFVGARDPVTRLKNLEETYRVPPEVISRNESLDPRITWIGHASLLIQVAGINILTDPSFDFVFPCFKRHIPPGIAKEKLPCIDLLLNSHNHGDHANQMDYFSRFNPLVFSGVNNGKWLKGMGFTHFVENDWWEKTVVSRKGQPIKITAVPAQHGSQTALMDANKMLWCGYVLEVGDKVLYFAGDTAMGTKMYDKEGKEHALFEQLKSRFPKIDVAFLPIAPEGEPLVHIDHEEAIKAFKILGAKEIVPIHWGAYRTGKEAIEDPILAFTAFARKEGIADQLRVLKVGESYTLRDEQGIKQTA